MKVRYYYHDGRGQEHYKEHEVTMTPDLKTGQVYASYPDPSCVGNGGQGSLGDYIRGKSGSWRIVRESMTPAERVLYKQFLAFWREYHLKTIRRNNTNPCFPRHIGKVTDKVNGIGGTYHTLYCDACKQTWHIDSGD